MMSFPSDPRYSFSLFAVLLSCAPAFAGPPIAADVTAEVFENRMSPIYVRATSDTMDPIDFVVTTPPQHGIVSKEIKVPGSSNIAMFLYTNVTPDGGTDTFIYVAKSAAGESKPARVSIRIVEAGLRWDLFAAGATSVSDTVNAFNNANFLFRLDWLFKEPWRTVEDDEDERQLLETIQTMMPDLRGKTRRAAETGKRGNRMNRALNARFTFETGVVAIPVIDEPAGTLEEGGEEGTEESDEEGEPIQATRNAFTFGGELIASMVGSAGDGRSLYEIGAGGRASYNVPIRADQLVEKDGITFINLAEGNQDPGFGLYEVFAKFRLTQFEDDDNEAYDVRKLRTTGNLHLVHPKNLEDLIVVEAGFQHNQELRISGPMSEPPDDGMPLNRWFFRFSATPEIPNAGHTRALLGVEVNNARDDGFRNVRVFYGLNVALDRLFRGN